MRWAALALLLAVTGCGGGDGEKIPTYRPGDEIRVSPGGLFQVEMSGSPGIGDDWRLVATPAPRIVEWVSSSGYDPPGEYEEDGAEPGRWLFKFEAMAPGTTEFELLNCYRCGGNDRPAPEYQALSERVRFVVSVTD